MEYYASLCRLCETTASGGKLASSWSDLCTPENESLVMKLLTCTSVEIRYDDKLPKRVCDRCRKSLEQAYNFRRQCEIAHAKLLHEIEFLEKNDWDRGLTIPPFCSGGESELLLSVKDEVKAAPSPLPAGVTHLEEHLYIKSELGEEDDILEDEGGEEYLAESDEPEVEFPLPSVQLKEDVKEDDDTDEEFNDGDSRDATDDEEHDDESTESELELKPLKVKVEKDGDKKAKREKRGMVRSCETCGEQFTNKKLLTDHTYKAHGKSVHQCKVCDKVFSRNSRLRDHEVLHTGVRQYQCPHPQCDKKYATQYGLKIHLDDIHADDLPYVCDKCGRGFSKLTRLRNHYAMHIETRNFECEICSKGFKTKNHLSLHMEMHKPKEQKRKRIRQDRKKTCICPYCGKVSMSLGTHNMHIRTHTGEQRYECHICFKRFTSSGSHKKHLLVHSGEKPHVCEFCNKSFRQKHHMTTHIRGVHTNEKPYQCKYCPKAFATRGNMQLHERSHGGGSDPAATTAAAATAAVATITTHSEMELMMLGGDCKQSEVIVDGNSLLSSHPSPMVSTSTPSPMLNPGIMIPDHIAPTYFDDHTQ